MSDLLILISSSKNLKKIPWPKGLSKSQPIYQSQAQTIAAKIGQMDFESLWEMLQVNERIAHTSYQRYLDWPHVPVQERWPALFLYSGEVYRGINAASLGKKELQRAQQCLGILSGLYGFLRPLDGIAPYRLEMNAPLYLSKPRERAMRLRDFWRQEIEKSCQRQELGAGVVVNLASKEYSYIANPLQTRARQVDVTFLDYSKGRYRFITAYGKKARGQMASWILREDIQDPKSLEEFEEGGYQLYRPDCAPDHLVFRRRLHG